MAETVAAPRAGRGASVTRRRIVIAAFVYIALTYLVFLLPWSTIADLTDEDGFFEYAGSAACFIGALFFLLTYLESRPGNRFFAWQTRRNVFFLLVALGLLFIGAEEISWGQRILDVQTPEALEEMNTQNEVSIHNLEVFEGRGLFKKSFNLGFLALVFVYCGVIPVCYRLWHRFGVLIDHVNLPLPPPLLCLLTVVVLVSFEVIKRLAPLPMQDPVGELREANLQVLFMMMSFWFFASARGESRRA